MKIKIEKPIIPDSHIISIQRTFGVEYFLTIIPKQGQSTSEIFEQIINFIKLKNATIISQDVFGCPDYQFSEVPDINHEYRTSLNWPITCLGDHDGSGLSGIFIWAISGAQVKPIYFQNNVIGSIVEDEFVRLIRLGGMKSNKKNLVPERQAIDVLKQIETTLKSEQMDFSNVIRTWFYNQNIISWYKEFNLVRSNFFQQRDIFSRLVPASTAVGLNNGAKTALVGGTLAVQDKSEGIQVFAVPSPLQGSAIEYGSSFSRAVELVLPDHRRLYISGTASIDSNGKTVYPNDAPSQVKLSMEVTDAILKSRKMAWSNITRAIAYFKNAEDIMLLDEHCRINQLPSFPVIITKRDICRDDLLFEIEVDAIN